MVWCLFCWFGHTRRLQLKSRYKLGEDQQIDPSRIEVLVNSANRTESIINESHIIKAITLQKITDFAKIIVVTKIEILLQK